MLLIINNYKQNPDLPQMKRIKKLYIKNIIYTRGHTEYKANNPGIGKTII